MEAHRAQESKATQQVDSSSFLPAFLIDRLNWKALFVQILIGRNGVNGKINEVLLFNTGAMHAATGTRTEGDLILHLITGVEMPASASRNAIINQLRM
jgi:hypothetical protein